MGQLVPFPSARAAKQQRQNQHQHNRPPSKSGDLIPLIPPSRLFIAGMAAQYPVIEIATRRLAEMSDRYRLIQERVLERLIKEMPELPATTDLRLLERLFNSPFGCVCGAASIQIRRDRHFYALGQSVWGGIDDPNLREFAQRCSVVFTEALHLARQTAGKNISSATA